MCIFAATLHDCRLLSKSEVSDYTKKELRELSIKNLYAKYFPGETYNAHRAYGDVLAMQKLFTTTPLASVLSLSNLTVKSVGCMMI